MLNCVVVVVLFLGCCLFFVFFFGGDLVCRRYSLDMNYALDKLSLLLFFFIHRCLVDINHCFCFSSYVGVQLVWIMLLTDYRCFCSSLSCHSDVVSSSLDVCHCMLEVLSDAYLNLKQSLIFSLIKELKVVHKQS